MDEDLKAMIIEHGLPQSYASTASLYFVPLVEQLSTHQTGAGKPLVVGIHGCQGSGKSTLATFLKIALQHSDLSVVVVSLDDVYLTKAQRITLSQTIHPLLLTRGVPGTHDIELAMNVINGLSNSNSSTVAIPRFDKAKDDRLPSTHWDTVRTPIDVIILEGWCLGVPPQDETQLTSPVNELEAQLDTDGTWRKYVNHTLQKDYPVLFNCVDQWVMLQAPSFDCVYQWRLEQEQKLAASYTGKNGHQIMSEEQVWHFIQHYQRLTEHGLRTLPTKVHHLFQLNEQRQIIRYEKPLN